MRSIGISLWVFLIFTTSALGQTDLGDIDQGYELASKTCAECHRVEKGQKSKKLSPVKSFQEIANNPARTALSLRVFLRTPHRNMPNFVLTEAETDNVISYIHSLR